MDIFRIASDRVRLGVTEVGGQLDRVIFQTDGGEVEPLHTAPWYDEAQDEAVPPMTSSARRSATATCWTMKIGRTGRRPTAAGRWSTRRRIGWLAGC
jgi:hypothetical protein